MKYAKNLDRHARLLLRELDARYGSEVHVATVKITDGELQVAPFAGSVDEEWVEQAKALLNQGRVRFFLPDASATELVDA